MNDLIKRSDVEDMLYDLFKNNAPEENEKIWNEAIGNVLDGLDEIESISDDMMKYLNFHKRNAISDLKKHNELFSLGEAIAFGQVISFIENLTKPWKEG